jgi:hypothetical protein
MAGARVFCTERKMSFVGKYGDTTGLGLLSVVSISDF